MKQRPHTTEPGYPPIVDVYSDEPTTGKPSKQQSLSKKINK